MFTACLPRHSQNPTRTNRYSGLIRNIYLLNKQMIIDNSCLGLANTQDERFTPFLVSRLKGRTVDIWIRDYNPPRCFQKKISGRSKRPDLQTRVRDEIVPPHSERHCLPLRSIIRFSQCHESVVYLSINDLLMIHYIYYF
jgi:hypothetical protein